MRALAQERSPLFRVTAPGPLASTATISSPVWRPSASPLGSSGRAEDAEGVWGPDIEQSFQEALAIYPPCGRRKVILSEEGRMYGRNELIARYIRLRTGKTRTRKQVSSHIQVLARRRARELQATLKFWQEAQPDEEGTAEEVKPFSQHARPDQQPPLPGLKAPEAAAPWPPVPPWLGRGVGSARLWMLEFSVFLEQWQDLSKPRRHLLVHLGPPDPEEPTLEAVDAGQVYDKFPDEAGGLRELLQRGPADAFFLIKFWADLNTGLEDEDEDSTFYGVSSLLESRENMVVTCSTKVCSFGKQVVEKVETEAASPEASGCYSYRVLRSPLCGYLVSFVHRLRNLPERHQRNSVLDNFTVLQVVTNRDTEETLLCVAFVFEVAGSGRGAQHHVFRLLKD